MACHRALFSLLNTASKLRKEKSDRAQYYMNAQEEDQGLTPPPVLAHLDFASHLVEGDRPRVDNV